MNKIYGFQGEYRWLSNFWILPEPIMVQGIPFNHTEALYVVRKCGIVERGTMEMLASLTPGECKKWGQEVPMAKSWAYNRVGMMRNILVKKFEIPEMREKLLATGDAEIVEANRWGDTFWGVDEATGEGLNTLGKLIMGIRESIRSEDILFAD